MRDFKQLKVWRSAHGLALEVYGVTNAFPRSELYALTSQLRRAATSIPANIAEGCGRTGDRELAHFLSIASGSATELEYHLLLTRDLGYLSPSEHDRLRGTLVEVQMMLTSLIKKLEARG